ncbi:MAG: RIO1 family regulatory kinase/ATPase [Chloroflexota bacterium]
MAKDHLNDLNNDDGDIYAAYEERFNPLNSDRQARRSRKPKVKHQPKKAQDIVRAELADENILESGSATTYQPSRYEEGWLMDSLTDFIRQEFIIDVLGLVKGGKEASVYRCEAHPTTGYDLLAAKVYRPRKFRQLRNDKMYREGRAILDEGGHLVKENNQRTMRALEKKSAFGQQVDHQSWLMYEYTTLQRLYAIGASVPEPIAISDNAILMTYIGGDDMAAPLLNDVHLEREEAQALFQEVLRNIELMLQNGMIHGDLSAYNILYWDGAITFIDFPQVTDSRGNSNAYYILQRDIERICAYFKSKGVPNNPRTILRDFWKRYVEADPNERAADLSRMEYQREEAAQQRQEQMMERRERA